MSSRPERLYWASKSQYQKYIREAEFHMDYLEAENKRLTELLNPMSTRDAELRDTQ